MRGTTFFLGAALFLPVFGISSCSGSEEAERGHDEAGAAGEGGAGSSGIAGGSGGSNPARPGGASGASGSGQGDAGEGASDGTGGGGSGRDNSGGRSGGGGTAGRGGSDTAGEGGADAGDAGERNAAGAGEGGGGGDAGNGAAAGSGGSGADGGNGAAGGVGATGGSAGVGGVAGGVSGNAGSGAGNGGSSGANAGNGGTGGSSGANAGNGGSSGANAGNGGSSGANAGNGGTGGSSTLLFFADFEYGGVDTEIWKWVGNSMDPWFADTVDGNYRAVSPVETGTYWQIIRDVDWADQVVEADVYPVVGSGSAGVVGRYNGFDNNYRLFVNKSTSSTVSMSKTSDGASASLGSASFSVVLGGHYRLKLSMLGDRIRGYVNDVLYFDVTDSTVLSGSAGVGVTNLRTQFDNVRVTSE